MIVVAIIRLSFHKFAYLPFALTAAWSEKKTPTIQ
jgi:hypothetical protein